MKFRLFEGTTDEMCGFVGTAGTCDLCGSTSASGFDLEDSSIFGAPSGSGFGCPSCLLAGRFSFRHVTDAGYIEPEGLLWFEPEPEDEEAPRVFAGLPDGPPEEIPLGATAPQSSVPPPPPSLELLRATPSFSTWNEVSWPLHCGDYMVYLGALSPDRVAQLAQGYGKSAGSFFESMVEKDFRAFLPLVSVDGDVVLHGFRCQVCREHRGIIDLS